MSEGTKLQEERSGPIRAMANAPESAASTIAREDSSRAEWYASLVDSGLLPDALLRWGIRRICAARLREESAGGEAAQQERRRRLLAELAAGPIAIRTEAANAQHYEVPAEFFQHVLGARMK